MCLPLPPHTHLGAALDSVAKYGIRLNQRLAHARPLAAIAAERKPEGRRVTGADQLTPAGAGGRGLGLRSTVGP